ncbi:MAG: ABC transporter ATP-binding protein [Anaerolineales bacterium]|nr:ABC transporter ATP-binding protein [Anaerolineales bacterium]
MNDILKLTRFLGPYRKQSTWALIFLTAVVVMDLAIPRLIQHIIDQGIAQKDQAMILRTTAFMLLITVLSTIFAILNNNLSVQASEGFGRDLREALFLKIQTFSFGNLDRLRTGQLMVRLTSDITMIVRIIRTFIRIGTRAPLLMIGSIILMFSTSPRLATTLMPLLLVMGVIIVWFISHTQPLYLAVQRKLDALNTVLQENIAGVRVVKAFNRAAHETDRFALANEDFAERSIRVMQWMAFLMPSLTFLINVGIVIVIWAGGLQAIHGTLTLGEIVAFTNYLLTTMTPLVIMSNLAQVMAAANVSAERVNEVLTNTPDVVDFPAAHPLPDAVPARVTYENVCFSYDGDCADPVLQNINLTAEPGETIAILGATGSGKSTLVNLIPRFYDVSGGRILIDGVDVRDLTQDSLLAQVGVALQETVLFSGTVRDNIAYGHPTATFEEIVAAAKAAQAHPFIVDLPDGYDTHVEQRGVNLSGGQKQRIAIARALLVQPKILILDDSTSAVDVETESKIQDALETIMRGRTSFIVAQRISTVLNADKIVVLDHGQIVALGTHRELMQSSPTYQEIYDSQLGDGVLAGDLGGQNV